MTEVKFGRIWRNRELVGYCSFADEQGRAVEIFCPPYKPLEVYVAGEKVKVQPEHVMIWTEVAGWLGIEETRRTIRKY